MLTNKRLGLSYHIFMTKEERTAYVYMVECSDNTLYTGWTYDPQARLKQHNSGRGAKYTHARLPVRLVYTEQLASERAARQREYALKQLSRKAKQTLIANYKPLIEENLPASETKL